MLGQVQFPAILRLAAGEAEVARFQESIRDQLPGYELEQQLSVGFSARGDAPRVATTPTFRFGTGDERWSVLLTSTSLTVEAAAGGEYSSYAEFADLFRYVWDAFSEEFRPGPLGQQGLRYVDHIEGSRTPSEWQRWVNPDLLAAASSDALSGNVTSALSEMRFESSEGRIVFRHGITSAAAPTGVPGFLLDFDAIHLGPVEDSETEAIVARFDASHDVLYRLFRWCITDHALAAFRQSKEDAGAH